MDDFDEGQVIEEKILKCSLCGSEVYQCRECGDYLLEGSPVYCMKDGGHLCKGCCEDFIEEKDSELKAKQEVKNE